MQSPRFTDLDLTDVDESGRSVTPTVAYFGSLCCLAALFGYDYAVADPRLGLQQFDWLLVAGLLAVAAYGLLPLVRRPALAGSLWKHVRKSPRFLAATTLVCLAFGVGLVGPLALAEPRVFLRYGHQPPVFTTIPSNLPRRCLGPVVDGRCHGTWRFPLGTTNGGFDVLTWTVYGLRTTTAVALIDGLILVAAGTLVGTVAGYVGGRTDEALMRYVDVQQVVPAFLVYIVLRLVTDGSLVVLVFVFGLLNWGGTARTVRSETRAVVNSGYVAAARVAGASDWFAIRTHVIPNVAVAALVTSMGRTSALVLAEATLAFLGFGPPGPHSLGRLAAIGLTGTQESLRVTPWVTLVPIAALSLTALGLQVAGESIREVVDTRG